MIVNILQNNKINKLVLPEKVYGVYSLLDDEGRMLANIEAVEDSWVLRANEYVDLFCEGKPTKDVKVASYFLYQIKNKVDNSIMTFMPTPSYEENVRHKTSKNQITIGGDESCDIYYANPSISGEVIVLTKNNNHWVIEKKSSNGKIPTYLSDKPFKKRNMFHGDWLFLYGLKVIVINDEFIINNPRNLLKLKNGSFTASENIKQTINYQSGIAEDMPLYAKEEYFNKPPRFRSVIEKKRYEISAPPGEHEDEEKPAILQYGPRMTMMITTGYSLINTLSQYAAGEIDTNRLIPVVISLVVMLLSTFMWPTLTRRYTKRKKKREKIQRQRKYTAYLDRKDKEIKERLSFERQVLVEENIPLNECQSIIYNQKRNLWERNVSDDDFLKVCIGTGNVKSNIDVGMEEDGKFTMDDETTLKKRFDELVEDSRYVVDAPMDVSLTEHQIMGVVGNNVLTKSFFDSMFLQLTTFHSYRDLKIFVITNKQNDFLWDYMKVLPHCWDNLRTRRYFANNLEDINEISNNLASIYNSRMSTISKEVQADDPEGVISDGGKREFTYQNFETYYLIFVDDLEMARNVPIIKQILKFKQNLGFSIVIRHDRLSNLPSECKTFIDVEQENSGLFESTLKEDNQKQFKALFNTDVDMYGCAIQLANIPIQAEKAKFELPSSISFLTMYNVGKVEQLNSLERWKKNNPVNSLSVPVGIGQDGELFKMDAHEKGWGPHGLVAGTTGSGKSEWLITYILSLAVNFHPDEVQFVLIDYKGGGLALSFENSELGIRVPHLAGTITNLDKSAINRALTSIDAELKRRQRMFNEAREKLHESSMDIYKYQAFYRKGELAEPISHLFLISDEFAELKSQEPEFLSQLVSTARIGRSLGVHLILATQKPSGVVNEQIWSNSRFHVCLRVQDRGDSTSMIKTPDAAMLKQTGSFYLQVGYNEFYAAGQSAYAGAKYYPSDIVKKKIDDSVEYIDNIGNSLNNYVNEDPNKKVLKEQGEELLNIVSYLSGLSKQEKMFCHQLWLSNVPEVIFLDEIKEKYNWKFGNFDLNVAIGEYDDPASQTQDIMSIDIANNTAIYGESGCGKENLLATIIWSTVLEHSPDEINFYIFDFGAETLRMFTKYPHVGEVVFQGENERVAGVIQMVVDEMAKRKEMFAEYSGTYESYINESGKTLPRIVVVINQFDVFFEQLSKIVNFLDTVFRDCTKYGVSFMCTATMSSVLRSRRGQFFENKLPLQLTQAFDYRDITGCAKGLIPKGCFGRGIGPCMDGIYREFQTALITNREEINALVKKNSATFENYYKTRAKSLPKIPDNVTSEELKQYNTDSSNVPIGYNFEEKDIAKFDFTKEKIFTICMDEIRNRMQSIYGLINIVSKVPGTQVRVVDFSGLYNGTNLDIRMFNSDFDAVLLAMKNDMEKRTATQNHAITFIIGAGILKTKLVSEGQKILLDYMDTIPKSVNSTTILVDSYARIRSLKIEPWFARINNGFGMWIGPGIDSQNIFNVKEITMEERKLNYPGMAYVINDSDYTLIKTILDEE